ncbi:MAG: hypothetical protein N3E37_00120 [Candidatus Micrarchaeota archaeon]|nr:hypothetical protein [Candidatus Micrarchaeota archaeon]
MMNRALIEELEIVLSQPHYNPLYVIFFLIMFVLGFYATFANSFTAITLLRAQKYVSSGKIPKILVMSIAIALIVPVLTVYLGTILNEPYAIAIGSVFFVLSLLGAYLGSKSRLDLLRELGFSTDESAKYSFILNFPTGTWENELTYFINYSIKVIIFLLKLGVVVFVLQQIWPFIKKFMFAILSIALWFLIKVYMIY